MIEELKVWQMLRYQQIWLQDPAPIKVAEKSRRIGLSWAEAYDAVMHAAAGFGDIAYISYSKDMTAGFIRDCADWAKQLHSLAAVINEEILIDQSGKEIKIYSINFPSGKKIEALSSAPRQIRSRGRPGDRIIIDEAAFVDNIDDLLKAAMAMKMWGGKIRIISTHSGSTNPFNALIEDVKSGLLNYSLHTIPLDRAIDDGLFKRVLEQQIYSTLLVDPKADVSEFDWSKKAELAWRADIEKSYRYPWHADEELKCIPADGAGTWISAEDYARAEHDDAGDPKKCGRGSIFIGYDVARRKDLAVMAVFEKRGDTCWLREMVTMENQQFKVQLDTMAQLIKTYRPERVAVDQTGMGEAVVEQLQSNHGSRLVEGVLFTSDRRLGVATALRDAFENALIKIPRNNLLRNDVRSIKRAPGVTSFAPKLISESRDTDGHADRFWAMALAINVALGGGSIYECLTIDKFAPSNDDFIPGGSGLRCIEGGIW